MPSLKITSNLNPSQWSSFVYNHPNGNVFQTPEMNEVYKKTKNYEPISFAVIDDNDEILGILLAVIQKEHSGFLGKFSTRSIIMGGPLIKDNNTEVLDFILTEYNKRIKGKAIYTQFRNQWQWNETEKEIFKKHGFEYESHLDIFVDLNKSEDELWKNLKSQARNKIRKAEKMGVDFKEIIPDGILDFAEEIFNYFDVPNISIDIAFSGNNFHLFEFQAVYFGTTTIEKSSFYFMKGNDRWEMFKEKSELEKEYVDSIVKFINRKFGGSN